MNERDPLDARDDETPDRSTVSASEAIDAARAGTRAGDDGRVWQDAQTAQVDDATDSVGTAPGPARFARARRGALLWNAGFSGVAAIILLVAWASGRAIDNAPDSTPLVLGVVLLVWTGILVGIAAGGVGRAPTIVVGVVNVIVGAIGMTLGWFNEGVPVLALVVAAQVTGFGIVQWVVSVRR